MSQSLQHTSVQILQELRGISEEEAEEVYKSLKSSRFSLDVYG
jgi:hypothetical protein